MRPSVMTTDCTPDETTEASPETQKSAILPAPERRTWEAWGEAKGLRRKTNPKAKEPTNNVDLEMARVYHRWPIGREMTEVRFNAALDEVRKLEFR